MLNSIISEKILKIVQLLEKIELQELEERRKICQKIDNHSYTKLLNHFYKNYEMTSIISQETSQIIEDMNLTPLSVLLNKLIKSFQVQLNKILLYQFLYIRFLKLRPEALSNTNSNSLANLYSESELQLLDNSLYRPTSSSSFANKNQKGLPNAEKSFNVIFKNFKSKMVKYKKEKSQIIQKETPIPEKILEENATIQNPENEGLARVIEMERNLADINHILDNKEKRIEEVNMLEARNIAAHSELVDVRNDIQKNKNSHVIYTGENLDYLMENEKNNKNLEDTVTDDILRIPYFSKSRAKVLKQTVNVKKRMDEEETQVKNESSKKVELHEEVVSLSHKTRVRLNTYDLRKDATKSLLKNKGTEPDLDIFDINKIFALEIVLQKKNDEVDSLEQELKTKSALITELEVLNNMQKADLKVTRESLEKALTKLAEYKVLEANQNIEDSNLKKVILNLQKELGTMETKVEKKDEEIEEWKIKVFNLTEALKVLQKKADQILEENVALKKEVIFLKADVQRRTQSYDESERKNTEKIQELEKSIVQTKKSSVVEMQTQDIYINGLHRKLDVIMKENLGLHNEKVDLEHRVVMLDIENDKSIVENFRKESSISKDPTAKSPRLNSDVSEDSKDKPPESFKLPRIRFESNELSKYTTPRHFLRALSESKETQTFHYQSNAEVQTVNLEISQNHDKAPLIAHFRSKTTNAQNLQELIQPSSVNNIVYPTKVQVLKKASLKKFQQEKKQQLEIRINESLENLTPLNSERLASNPNTERTLENPLLSTQKRKLSFNENVITKIISRQEATKSLYFEKGKTQNLEGLLRNNQNNQSTEEIENVNRPLKTIFELNSEEKEKKIGLMYATLKKKMEENSIIFESTTTNNTKNLRRSQLKKNRSEEFAEDKLNNFNDFREFFLKFIDLHRKCGKDCSHLKLFYERIGWTEEKNIFLRQEIKPIKTVIDSLPKIKI